MYPSLYHTNFDIDITWLQHHIVTLFKYHLQTYTRITVWYSLSFLSFLHFTTFVPIFFCMYLVKAQNMKYTFLRSILFYFITGTQLLRSFCYIIFRFSTLFFILLHYFISTYYYFYLTYIVFSSAFFRRT